MKNLIRKILRESSEDKFIDLIVNKLKSNQIKAPYFMNLKNIGLDDTEIIDVLELFTNGTVNIKIKEITDKSNYITYVELNTGYWEKIQYDDRHNETYWETSDNQWHRKEYDANGNVIYYENYNGIITDYR